jgi:RNA polymerase sigma-70 factor (ECF subfamily)
VEPAEVSLEPWTQPDEHEERRLIERARVDSDAFAELYRRYMRRVFRYLLTYTDSVDDAADLTQHVFLRALEALPAYRHQGVPFAAWLLAIARNAAMDLYRRRRRAIPWDHVSAEWHPFSDSDPEATALQAEGLNRLRLLVAQLDNEKQEMLYLRFAGGLKSAEIALVLGKSEVAVQKALRRTLLQLKERYDAEI